MKKLFQPVLFDELTQPDEQGFAKPVNVASVPQRSPFRYPGGKTWFIPTFRDWIHSLQPKPRVLIEPFTGGGIVSLTAVCENLVDRSIMVELDREIAAVWRTIVDGNANWLANRILNFELTRESAIATLNNQTEDIKEIAFKTIVKNRTLHGGILAEGSGFLKHGENGKGILSRWYPATLAKRLMHLDLIRHRLDFRNQDGLGVMQQYLADESAVFFVDPPYTAGGKKAGKRLYTHCDLDHEALFSLCERIQGRFLMTYDNADEVRQLAKMHHFQMCLIPMTNTHNTQMNELLISKDLSWLSESFKIEAI